MWAFSGGPIAGALLVLSVPLAVASPQGALYASCAAIPLVFQPIHVGSLQLGLLEIGVVIATVGAAFRLAYELSEESARLSFGRVDHWAAWLLPGLLLLVGTLSLVWMPFDAHRAEALRTWRWVIVEPLALYVLARMAIARDGPKPLTAAMVIPAGVVSLAAVWQLVSASSSFSVDEVHRSTATYLHPNNLALYLERAFMLVCVPALFVRSRIRWVLLGLSVVLMAGLATTFSRGALLGMGFGFAVVLLAHPVRFGFRWLSAVGLAIVCSFVLLAGDRFAGSESSGLGETRRYLWTGAVRLIRDFPLTGIGLDQFLWLNQRRYIDPRIWSERYVSHPHNLILDSWLSLGIPGVLLLAIFVIAGGLIVWRARSGATELSPWQLGALGCLAAGFGHGMVDNGYLLADLSAMTWLAMALLLNREGHERSATNG